MTLEMVYTQRPIAPRNHTDPICECPDEWLFPYASSGHCETLLSSNRGIMPVKPNYPWCRGVTLGSQRIWYRKPLEIPKLRTCFSKPLPLAVGGCPGAKRTAGLRSDRMSAPPSPFSRDFRDARFVRYHDARMPPSAAGCPAARV